MSDVRAGVAGVIARHRAAAAATAALLLATMLAGIALLGLSGGFLTAAALTFGVAGGFNFFSPSAGIRALTLARIASRYGEKLVGHEATLRIARDLRVWFFGRLLALSPGQLSGLRGGDLLARLAGDVDAVDGLLVRALGPLLALAACSVVLAGVALWLDPVLGGWLAIVAAVSAACVSMRVAYGRRAEETACAEARADLRASLHELYDGAADLAALDAGERWLARLPPRSQSLSQHERRRRQRVVDGTALHALVVACGWTALLWLACRAMAGGRLDAPAAIGLCFAAMALFEAAAGAAAAWQSLQAAFASMRRIDAVAGQAPAIVDPSRPQPLPRQAALSFEGVEFGWSGRRRVLDGIDLRIEAGERVAIRGDSGIGKSTLAALALRALEPQAGAVRWGGVDLRAATQADWHARVAWLPQEAPVFAGTLADNLRLGQRGADDARLWAALACVRLDDWARAAGGLEAWLGESGAGVSGGQARRIALARALLREAPLLVLDEPIEALDEDTADAVMRGLPGWAVGRSVLLITHARLPPGVAHRELLLRDGRLHPG